MEFVTNKAQQEASAFKIIANGDEELSLKLNDHKLVKLLPKPQTIYAYSFYFRYTNLTKLVIIIVSKGKLINILVVSESQLKVIIRLYLFQQKYLLDRRKCVSDFENSMALKHNVKSLEYRTIDEYKYISPLGEGRYGEVYKALDMKTGETVAIKKVNYRFSSKSFCTSSIREIYILRRLEHKNIIKLKAVFADQPDINSPGRAQNKYLVLEFMDFDLYKVLYDVRMPLVEEYVAGIMKQILEGLNFCHGKNVMHRDLKPNNILLNSRGEVKLADFGLAREHDEYAYTQKVVTLYYRAPELFLGDKHYGMGIDIWSCGCILAELFKLTPLFCDTETDIEHLDLIYRLCGTATSDNWPSVENLPLFNVFKPTVIHTRCLWTECSYVPENARNLLDKMLQLDPAKRVTTKEALESDWFKNA